MLWVRKGVVHFLAFIMLISLVGGVMKLGVNANLSSPDKLEGWLVQSKIYDRLSAAMLDQAQSDAKKEGSDTSVSLNTPAAKEAAKQAFSADFLQKNVNSFIEANYAWLKGKTDKPEFKVDFEAAKKSFGDNVGQAVADHLRGLTTCTPEQLAQIQIPLDPLTVTCRPATLDPTAEGQRVAEEIKNSKNFVDQPVLTADTLGKDTQNNEQPYYRKLSKLPQLYQLGEKLPLIAAGLVILTGVGIFFIAPTRRRGLRRIAWVFTAAGVLLIATKFLGDFAVNKVRDQALNASTKDQLNGPVSNILDKIVSALTHNNIIGGVVFIVIALIIFAVLFQTREGREKKVKTPKEPRGNDDISGPSGRDQEEEGDFVADRPSQPGVDLKDRMRRPTPTGPPALGGTPRPQPGQPGGRPRPPKKPRLIQ